MGHSCSGRPFWAGINPLGRKGQAPSRNPRLEFSYGAEKDRHHPLNASQSLQPRFGFGRAPSGQWLETIGGKGQAPSRLVATEAYVTSSVNIRKGEEWNVPVPFCVISG